MVFNPPWNLFEGRDSDLVHGFIWVAHRRRSNDHQRYGCAQQHGSYGQKSVHLLPNLLIAAAAASQISVTTASGTLTLKVLSTPESAG